MPEPAPDVPSRLEADRRELLDLSLRNPLLNYRPRARGLEFDGESPEQVFEVLVREGKRMSFVAAPAAEPPGVPAVEPAVEPAGPREQPDEPTAGDRPSVAQADRRLQTRTPRDQLQARLLATFHAARASIEEQGVNTLYLALGMLGWYESEASPKRLLAPLVLVPVALERTDARERFRIRYTEEDLGPNLSLAEKLRADYGVALPDLPDADELDLGRYFDAAAEAVGAHPRWSVDRQAIALGFFSFGKFLMYRDLDGQGWPEGTRPAEHPILRALIRDGFREPPPALGDDEPLDAHLAPGDVRHVVDADSSQALAILDVKQGRSLVIQGPPGTGKSQTITNLIAEAIGQGKSVLFVAEKLAALEVVKRRLDAVGLGDACLELHSRKTKKKGVLDELRRTLAASRPRVGPFEDDLRLLGEVRDRLNAYVDAVNAPIGPSGVSPHEAIGALLRLRDELDGASLPPFEVAGVREWSSLDFKRRSGLVEQLQGRLGVLGVPAEHPFWGARRTVLLPTEADRLRALLDACRSATLALREADGRLARALGLPPAAAVPEAGRLVEAARRAREFDGRSGTAVGSDDWETRAEDLRELLDAGIALAGLHARYDATLVPEAWDQDLLETRSVLNAQGRRWWRLFSPTYHRARRKLASLCRGEAPRELDRQLDLIDAVRAARGRSEVVGRHEPLGARLFGPRWRGERSDWPALSGLADWTRRLRADVRERRLPGGVLELLAGCPNAADLAGPAQEAEAALARGRDVWRAVADYLDFDAPARFPGASGLEDVPFDDQVALLDRWSRRLESLPELVAFNHLAARCRAEGLQEVVAAAETWAEAGRLLAPAFRRHWFESLLERTFEERDALSGFDGTTHEHDIRTFRELDRRSLLHSRARLALEHWERLPRHEGGGQLATLRREFEKKTRHLPLRQLLARAGNAVKAIKPVFMMSPLSVAAYLAPGNLEFDLVVFDEASQVKPVDAFGALLRGRQAVVVGDSRQLPPSSFFDRLTGGDDAEDDEPASGDVESVLGLFLAQGAPERMLRWHYRSRHESLIAVSNHEFYDGRLVVFPSPDSARDGSGLVLRHLPETLYDRGKTQTNPAEAGAVADAVMAHARAQLARPEPDRLTLGVAAFSVPQREAILDEIERRRREDPSCEPYFALDTAEPFFVKNLENVQGDERDVIYISVGYGRTAEGTVAMSFGPLNGEGGERRLNVLITRARVRCEVFTNLTAGDIDLDRTQARGVRALKTFLAFAESGRLEGRPAPGEAAESPFEWAVREAVARSGWDVREGVGSAIDLAIVDPDRPGRYRLGVGADGASYHAARSARDRDRLRPQVLEGLGWRLRHAWSADWFRDPEEERERLLAAIEEARGPGTTSSTPAPAEPAVPRLETADSDDGGDVGESLAPSGAAPYELAKLDIRLGGRDLHEVPIPRLATWVARVVRTEGPVHVEEVARRIVEAAGIKRIGNRIQACLDRAVDHAAARGTIRRAGEFLWHAERPTTLPRDRSGLPAASRKLDLVPPEELSLAVERVVADAFGMEPAAIPPAACRLLGFPRVSDEMRARVEEIIEAMTSTRRLDRQGNHLVVRNDRQESA